MDVCKDDQRRICDFAVLTARAQRLRTRIAAATRDTADAADAARDLEEQQLFAEDDAEAVFVRVGAAFVGTTMETAVGDARRRAEEGSCALKAMSSELQSIDAELASLKAALRAKFGDSIQLEM